MEKLAGYYNTFLIKIWCDVSGSKLRGYIQHAGTHQQTRFTGSEEMNRFILNHLDVPGSDDLEKRGDTN
jgi:hypothetical protein